MNVVCCRRGFNKVSVDKSWVSSAFCFFCFVTGSKPRDNPSFFSRMILDLALYFYSASVRKCHQLSPSGASFSLDEHEVTWLCLYAFQMCLRRTQSRYREILTFLSKSLSQIHLSNRIKPPATPWNAALTKLVRKKSWKRLTKFFPRNSREGK